MLTFVLDEYLFIRVSEGQLCLKGEMMTLKQFSKEPLIQLKEMSETVEMKRGIPSLKPRFLFILVVLKISFSFSISIYVIN